MNDYDYDLTSRLKAIDASEDQGASGGHYQVTDQVKRERAAIRRALAAEDLLRKLGVDLSNTTPDKVLDTYELVRTERLLALKDAVRRLVW